MRWLGKLLSCFVTERKHRASKAAALHVFRNMEHTVLRDVINQQCSYMRGGLSVFCEFVLTGAHALTLGGVEYLWAKHCILPCGELWADDIVILLDGIVGKVLSFWQCKSNGNDIHMKLEVYAKAGGRTDVFCIVGGVLDFVDVRRIVDACIWYPYGAGLITIIRPYRPA